MFLPWFKKFRNLSSSTRHVPGSGHTDKNNSLNTKSQQDSGTCVLFMIPVIDMKPSLEISQQQ